MSGDESEHIYDVNKEKYWELIEVKGSRYFYKIKLFSLSKISQISQLSNTLVNWFINIKQNFYRKKNSFHRWLLLAFPSHPQRIKHPV